MSSNLKEKKSHKELKEIANVLRKRIIETGANSRIPHIGSCLSCIDLLVYLYWNELKIDSQTKKKIPSSVNFEMSTSSSIKKYKSIKPKKNQQKVPNSRNKKKIKTLKKLY